MDSEERINNLRNIVKSHLQNPEMLMKISNALKSRDRDAGFRNELVKEVINEVSTKYTSDQDEVSLKFAELPPSGKRHLQLKVTHGCAFLNEVNSIDSFLEISVFFLNKRCVSKKVPLCCEPQFSETFYFCLDSLENRDCLTRANNDLVITIIKVSEYSRCLLGSCTVNWRKALLQSDGYVINQEVFGRKSDCGISIGILNLRLKIVPLLKDVVTVKELELQQKAESNSASERNRLFLFYTKQWWNEFINLRQSHNERNVKIFADDEYKNTRLACSFLQPIRSHLIESPSQASRFVSLFSFDEDRSSINSSESFQQWMTLHSFVATRNGQSCNHALLLCSLLLGFGLDSYVCIGKRIKGIVHAWVITFSNKNATFWEPHSGNRYNPDEKVPYQTIDCLFNNKMFYGNIQPTNLISNIKFHLNNPVFWKEISPESIQSMNDPGPTIELRCSVVDPHQLAFTLEREIRKLVREERSDLDLDTKWSDELGHLLQPALHAYELERAENLTVSNEDFEKAIRHSVPAGFTFKAFPGQFNHTNSRLIYKTCMRSDVCQEVVRSAGEKCVLAIKVKVYTYPEDVLAVWVMIAAQYMCIM